MDQLLDAQSQQVREVFNRGLRHINLGPWTNILANRPFLTSQSLDELVKILGVDRSSDDAERIAACLKQGITSSNL